jgi:hypothetical protein
LQHPTVIVWRMGGNEDRHDRQAVAGLMEVFEVKPIAIDLIEARSIVLARAQLVFDHEHNAARQ